MLEVAELVTSAVADLQPAPAPFYIGDDPPPGYRPLERLEDVEGPDGLWRIDVTDPAEPEPPR